MLKLSFKQLLKASLLVQVSLLFLWGCDSSSRYQQFSGPTMGTSYHIKVQFSEDVESDYVQQAITQRLEQIEQSMSTYRQQSEISRFNRLPVNTAMSVGDDFLKVFTISKEVYLLSAGAFNPSVGPLVDLWGFGPVLNVEQFQKTPSAMKIQSAVEQMNFDQVVADKNQLVKHRPVRLDFSAVAKGYAVDQIALLLRSFGADNFMVEIGGEVATLGLSPRGQHWRIGIELPRKLKGRVASALVLNNAAVATSGDYRNYLEIDGKRYSHTIDPRNGYPVDHKLSSVTVITDDVASADAWATALMVLGEQQGYELAKTLNLAAFFIYRQDAGFVVKSTAQMEQFLAN